MTDTLKNTITEFQVELVIHRQKREKLDSFLYYDKTPFIYFYVRSQYRLLNLLLCGILLKCTDVNKTDILIYTVVG